MTMMDKTKIEYPPTGETFLENTKEKRGTVFFLTLFTVIFSIPEIPLFPGPRQGELLYYGWAVTKGLVPYRDFWDNGSPGVYFIYALALKIFGHSYESVNIFDILWRCLTVLAVYALGTRMFSRKEGLVAGIVYAVAASLIGSKFGYNGLPESFAALPLILSVYFFYDEKMRFHVLSGMCIATAIIIKLPFIVVLLVQVGIIALKQRESWEPRPKRAKLLGFLYGAVNILCIPFFYFLLSRAFDNAFNEIILYNVFDNSNNWLTLSFLSFVTPVIAIASIMGIAALLVSLMTNIYRNIKSVETSPFSKIVSFSGAIIIIATVGCAYLISNTLFGQGINNSVEFLRGRMPMEKYLSAFDENMSADYEIASYLREHTEPGDTVISSSPRLNFLSERLDASGFAPSVNKPMHPIIKEVVEGYVMERKERFGSGFHNESFHAYYGNETRHRLQKGESIEEICDSMGACEKVFDDNSIISHKTYK